MGILRAFGYAIGIVIIIVGIVTLPIYGNGLALIIPGAIMIWALKKGGEVANMRKDLKQIRKMEEERFQDDLANRKRSLSVIDNYRSNDNIKINGNWEN